MLHRSFKSAKCKTALKLAVSRIKLLKNKREAQVRQLKRELAKLLESGQDQTARIRVEHVVREEKTMAAYDLIEIYCELIAARLPMIEAQKICPIDLKEAISSVIFASPRCSDIPELMDVRKHITAKYGKEFISAAVELRPDCGVNRLLVEKLSAKAPDGPTKIKILTAIAEEHNVKWEPKSFGESDAKSSQDSSQVGPNTYEKDTYVEHPQVHVPPVRDEKGPPNIHASSQHNMQDVSANLDKKATFAHKNVGGNKSATSNRSNPEIRSSGIGNQEMGSTNSHSENRRDISMGRKNWNMEFTDAASAAQAAAESAERASMAARAAAELSNREKITRQYSSGSQSSSGSGLRDDFPQDFAFHDGQLLSAERAGMDNRTAAEQSKREEITRKHSAGSQSSYKRNEVPQEYPTFHDEKQNSTGSVNSTFQISNSGTHNEQINTRGQDRPVRSPDEYYSNSHESVVKHPQLTSLTSSRSNGDDNPFAMDSKMDNTYPQNNSLEQENRDYLDEVSMEKQASRTEVDFGSQLHGDVSTENTDHFGYGRTDRQFSKGSSSAHFITSDDHNVLNLNGGPMMGKNTVGNLFVTDEESTQRDFPETNFYNDTAVVFDDSASEDDEYRFVLDETYGEQGSGSFSASGNKSQIDPLANRNDWSPGHVTEEEGGFSSQSHFSEVSESLKNSAVSSGKEDLLPVTFDDSDGPSSESEEDLVKSKGSGSYGYGNSVPDQSARSHGALGSSPRYDKNVDSDRKFGSSSSLAVSDTVEEHITLGSSPRYDNNDSDRKFGSSSSLAVSDTVEEHIKGKIDINNVPEKNLGYDDLPSSKQSSKGRSSVLGSNLKTTVLESESPDTSNVTETLEESHVERGKELKYETLKGGLRNKGYTRPPYLKSSADKVSSLSGDISVENEQTLPSARTYLSSESRGQDTYVRKASRVNKSRGVREHIASSDSDNYDLVQNSQETMTSGIQKEENEVSKKSSSRATINYFDSDSASEDEIPKQINSVSLSRPVGGFSRRTTASSKSGAGLGWKSPNERGNQEMASSRMKPIPESNRSSRENTKSSATARVQVQVQPSSALPKTVTPENAEASVSSNSSSKDNAYASHVHPKLPDYDSFAAHFLSLRKGRQ